MGERELQVEGESEQIMDAENYRSLLGPTQRLGG